jgi:hypothetical protein
MGSEIEKAGDSATKKLEDLYNLPWSSPLLTDGEHDDASNNHLRWRVTTVRPRLKKIEVIAKHQHRVAKNKIDERGRMVFGYRYDDF